MSVWRFLWNYISVSQIWNSEIIDVLRDFDENACQQKNDLKMTQSTYNCDVLRTVWSTDKSVTVSEGLTPPSRYYWDLW